MDPDKGNLETEQIGRMNPAKGSALVADFLAAFHGRRIAAGVETRCSVNLPMTT